MNKQRGFYNTEGAVFYGAVLCITLTAGILALFWLVPECWDWIKAWFPEIAR